MQGWTPADDEAARAAAEDEGAVYSDDDVPAPETLLAAANGAAPAAAAGAQGGRRAGGDAVAVVRGMMGEADELDAAALLSDVDWMVRPRRLHGACARCFPRLARRRGALAGAGRRGSAAPWRAPSRCQAWRDEFGRGCE